MKCARHEIEMLKDPKTGLLACRECNQDPFLEAQKQRRIKRLGQGDPEELNFDEK